MLLSNAAILLLCALATRSHPVSAQVHLPHLRDPNHVKAREAHDLQRTLLNFL